MVQNYSDTGREGINSPSLKRHYQTVGQALLNYEKLCAVCPYRAGRFKLFFQAEVSFVTTETLESYLEDLLDLGVKENSLFIKSPARIYVIGALILAGMLGSFAVGLYSATSGASWIFSFSVSVITSIPFAMLWHFFPIDRLSRRMRFARLLSREISRRRGTDNTAESVSSIFSSFLGSAQQPNLKGITRGSLN